METSYHENYTKQLQRLLNAVNKSHRKYLKASDQIESQEFKDHFRRYTNERSQIIAELKEAIHKLGGQTHDNADAETAVHHSDHTKTDAKKDQTVLESLRASEQETLDTYDEVLQGSILEEFDLKTLIMSQRLIINEAYTELDKRYFELFKLSQPY